MTSHWPKIWNIYIFFNNATDGFNKSEHLVNNLGAHRSIIKISVSIEKNYIYIYIYLFLLPEPDIWPYKPLEVHFWHSIKKIQSTFCLFEGASRCDKSIF